jgi:hypothetical protein
VWLDLDVLLALGKWMAQGVDGSWRVFGAHQCGSLPQVLEAAPGDRHGSMDKSRTSSKGGIPRQYLSLPRAQKEAIMVAENYSIHTTLKTWDVMDLLE